MNLKKQKGCSKEEETAEEEVNPNFDILNKASEEFYSNDGNISAETLEELGKLDSNDLVSAYIEMQGQQRQSNDLTDQQAADIRNMVGGDEQYGQLTSWAAEALSDEYITAYDNIVETGDVRMIQLALAGLQAEYEKANGYEGEMLTGKAAQPKVDAFRSQAEVVRAMQDPRYDTDPAYRQDVFAKLDRSNLEY